MITVPKVTVVAMFQHGADTRSWFRFVANVPSSKIVIKYGSNDPATIEVKTIASHIRKDPLGESGPVPCPQWNSRSRYLHSDTWCRWQDCTYMEKAVNILKRWQHRRIYLKARVFGRFGREVAFPPFWRMIPDNVIFPAAFRKADCEAAVTTNALW
jgi:hypothetical protein